MVIMYKWELPECEGYMLIMMENVLVCRNYTLGVPGGLSRLSVLLQLRS